MWVKAWVAVGNSRKTGPVAVWRASAKCVETEMRSAGKPASGPVLVSSSRLSGQAGRSGPRSCPRAWGLSPWCELTLAIIVVDRKGQDGFHENAADCRPRQARREGDPPGWPEVQDRPR